MNGWTNNETDPPDHIEPGQQKNDSATLSTTWQKIVWLSGVNLWIFAFSSKNIILL